MTSALIPHLFLSFVVFFKIIISSLFGYGIVSEIVDWTPSFHLRRLIAHGRYSFIFQAELLPDDKSPELGNASVGDYFLMVFMALAQLQRLILGDFCDIFALSAAFSLWTVSKCFADDVRESMRNDGNEICWENKVSRKPPWVIVVVEKADPRTSWQSMFKSFQAIQRMAELMNVAYGSQITWYLAEGLMVYAINLNCLLTASNELHRLRYLTFYGWTIMILYFSADVGHQLETVRKWMFMKNHINEVPISEGSLVLQEGTLRDIGIRGSNRVTITYSFVAGVR